MPTKELLGEKILLLKYFRLIIGNNVFLCSLVDLPTLIEAQKTLDFRTFYKSVDVSQLMYVHNKSISFSKGFEEWMKFAKEFNPLDDHEFLELIFKR